MQWIVTLKGQISSYAMNFNIKGTIKLVYVMQWIVTLKGQISSYAMNCNIEGTNI